MRFDHHLSILIVLKVNSRDDLRNSHTHAGCWRGGGILVSDGAFLYQQRQRRVGSGAVSDRESETLVEDGLVLFFYGVRRAALTGKRDKRKRHVAATLKTRGSQRNDISRAEQLSAQLRASCVHLFVRSERTGRLHCLGVHLYDNRGIHCKISNQEEG